MTATKDQYSTMHNLMNRLLAQKEANARELEALLPGAMEKIADGESLGNRINELLMAEVMLERGFPSFQSQYVGVAVAYRDEERGAKLDAEAKELAERLTRIELIKKGAARRIVCKISASTIYVDKEGVATIVTPTKKIIELGTAGSVEYDRALAPYSALGWFQ